MLASVVTILYICRDVSNAMDHVVHKSNNSRSTNPC